MARITCVLAIRPSINRFVPLLLAHLLFVDRYLRWKSNRYPIHPVCMPSPIAPAALALKTEVSRLRLRHTAGCVHRRASPGLVEPTQRLGYHRPLIKWDTLFYGRDSSAYCSDECYGAPIVCQVERYPAAKELRIPSGRACEARSGDGL